MKKQLLLLVMSLFFIGCGCAENFSAGERIGVVTKISKKGLVFDSWEAAAVIALPSDVGGFAQPEQFGFTVDPIAVDAVKEAASSGKRVRLHYRQWFIAPPTIDHQHVVFKVDSLK